MDITASILGIISASAFSTTPLSEPSGGQLKQNAKKDASNIIDPSESLTNNADANLDKIKEEIKKMAVMPSTDEIVSKYGITTEQAEQVLAQACMEVATAAGGTPEQITKTASNMYLIAEMADSKDSETFDIGKILNESRKNKKTEEEKDLSAQQIADKYDITLQQSQAVIDAIKKDEENSNSSITASDLSAEPTYSIRSGSSGTSVISINNSGSLALSTISYGT